MELLHHPIADWSANIIKSTIDNQLRRLEYPISFSKHQISGGLNFHTAVFYHRLNTKDCVFIVLLRTNQESER